MPSLNIPYIAARKALNDDSQHYDIGDIPISVPDAWAQSFAMARMTPIHLYLIAMFLIVPIAFIYIFYYDIPEFNIKDYYNNKRAILMVSKHYSAQNILHTKNQLISGLLANRNRTKKGYSRHIR